MNRLIPWLFFSVLMWPTTLWAATVAVLPVEGEITSTLRQQVGDDIRDALVARADVVSTPAEVRRALEQLDTTEALSLEQLSQLSETLDVEFILIPRVTPLPGQYRLELSAFQPEPPGLELLERVIVEADAPSEIRRMLNELFSRGSTSAPPIEEPPVEEPPVEEPPTEEPPTEEPPTEEPPTEEPPTEEPPEEPRRERGPRPEYGEQPLEINIAGGPAVVLTDLESSANGVEPTVAGGRITVGVGYSFLAAYGLGLRVDFIANFGNADAFGATIGTGFHWAPIGGIPLFIGARLGLGVLQGSSGAQATYFLLRPELLVAYRIADIFQIELRPLAFSFLFGETTVVQYEGLLSVGVTLAF